MNAEEAFESLFNELYTRLFAYCFDYVKDQYVAEEIVEEAMLFLWERREDLDHIKNIKAYMYSVVRNKSYTFLNKKQQTVHLEDEMYDAPVEIDSEIIEEEVYAVLIEALEILPEKCRKVFELSCIEGLKYKDIAEDMGISVNTVKSQRARAIELLKKNLDNHPLLLLFLASL
ncbi:RNA polymerase sigma-70 factor [Joostella atrarenae]|uniref:RNA polymerase sigma-70 factor n=1 Tax=Joostella atrarenae TaxID=679257 RepID=UPI001F027D60|nr:RNA polymerase sigma-70 factor [Joostella atrarenae]